MEEDITHHDELGVENLYLGLVNYFATAKISNASVLVFNDKGDCAGSVKLNVTFDPAPPAPAPSASL